MRKWILIMAKVNRFISYNIIVVSVFVTLLFSLITGCSDSFQLWEKNYNINYSVNIADTALEWFPIHIKGAFETSRSSNAFLYNSNLYDVDFVPVVYSHLFLISDSSIIECYREIIAKKAKAVYSVTDTSFAIADKFVLMQMFFSDVEKIQNYLYQHKSMDWCPSFIGFDYMLDLRSHPLGSYCGYGSPSDTNYVLKSGNVSLMKKAVGKEWYLLPKEKRHGYTFGVTISSYNKYIHYWIVTW